MISLPAQARRGIYAEAGAYAAPVLLDITHGVAGYPNPLRIVNNTENLTYGGNTYLAFPFSIDLPDTSSSGEISNARLVISAVDQQIPAILRSTAVPPTVTARAMYYESASYFEPLATWSFTLRNVSGNIDTISADLIFEESLDYKFLDLEFRPNSFPGLF